MCGIVGYVGKRPVVDVLVDGLRRLEYRGYDSAGIAVAGNGHGLVLRRASGKLASLEQKLASEPVAGTYGLGHTRWATHGQPSERNSHPHTDCSGRFAVVHNGIIENYAALKERLIAAGHQFTSDTDTEVIAHLIEAEFNGDLVAAVRRVVAELEGSYALGVMTAEHRGRIVIARMGAPVIVGVGEREMFLASDVVPILPYTRRVLYLSDGDIAVLEDDHVEVTDFAGATQKRQPVEIHWDGICAEKNGYRHFMQKEIFEQPCAIRDTLEGRVNPEAGHACLDELAGSEEMLANVSRIHLIACGTSLHAALLGKWMIEQLGRVPVEVDQASEYRYRNPVVDPHTLAILISQSGETADTLAAAKEARARGALTLAITNVPGSTLMRESDLAMLTHAGPEVGVAATKTFTAQLVTLFLIAVHFGRLRKTLSEPCARKLLEEMARIPTKLEKFFEKGDEIEALAKRLSRATDFLFLGRGPHYPIALEGALKLKEISYIHAEGFAAGEMKHGPNALIDENLPVVFLATYEPGNAESELLYQKTISNMEEVRARQGIVIAIVNAGDKLARNRCDFAIELPVVCNLLMPFLSIAPLQLLAYHIALHRGCDVDQPRNLAKSVTVE